MRGMTFGLTGSLTATETGCGAVTTGSKRINQRIRTSSYQLISPS
jgi:hypothetical protein